MKTAKEVRSLMGIMPTELEDIERQIESAASRGMSGILVGGMSDETKKVLEDNGYVIKECDDLWAHKTVEW